MGWHDEKTHWGNGVQEPGADLVAASGTADAALELCSLAPSLLQTGTERQAFMTVASVHACTSPLCPFFFLLWLKQQILFCRFCSPVVEAAVLQSAARHGRTGACLLCLFWWRV